MNDPGRGATGVNMRVAVKLALARVLYSEEELFAVASPSDITLFRVPKGENVEQLAVGDPVSICFPRDSKWVLDIFGGPYRCATDLSIQTDHALDGVRTNSFDATPARPFNARSVGGGVPSSPLGNTRSMPAPTLLAPATTTSYQEPYIHVGTWVPLVVTDASRGSGGFFNTRKPSLPEYEDVLVTTTRAREYVDRFRRMGRPVTILSLHTTLLPLAVACPNSISQRGVRSLYDGVYHLSEADLQRGFVQAVRLWFSFDCEQTISVTKNNGTLGVKPLRQQDGWIVVQALPGSPAFSAGMRGDEVFLTHVNGVDVSPHAFPSVCDRFATQISWKDCVIPLVEKTETCIFTFF